MLCCAALFALHDLIIYLVHVKQFPVYPPSFQATKPWDIMVLVTTMPSQRAFVSSFVDQMAFPWPVRILPAVVPGPGRFAYRDRSRDASSSKVAGCTLSHVQAAQTLLKSKHAYALVFEDDNVLTTTRQHVLDTISNAPADASFINLSPCGRMVRSHAYDNFYYDGGSMCTNAYLMDRSMARVWQSQSNPHAVIPADYVSGMVAYTQLLPSYHVHPPLFAQQSQL